MFDYINIQDIYGELFFKFPKALLYGQKYKNLSNDAKIAYIILKDRLEYSIQNNWVDENQQVYFIFTNDELQGLLNCAKPKVIKIKKELEEAHLLKQIQQGLNKPNKLYLANLDVQSHEVYLKTIQSLDKSGSNKNLLPKKEGQTVDKSGSNKNLLPKKEGQTVGNSGSNKNLHNLDIENKQDTLKEDTKKIDTDKAQQLDQELLATFHLTNTQTFLTENSLKFIALFSKTFDQAYETVGIIQRAKKKVENETGIVVIGEDWQEEIELHLRRVVQKIRTDHKIKNTNNYMFKSFCYFFQECSHQLTATSQKETTPEVLMYNFLEGESL
ncbi:replication initiator protein A [Enterococcus sp. LJL90]